MLRPPDPFDKRHRWRIAMSRPDFTMERTLPRPVDPAHGDRTLPDRIRLPIDDAVRPRAGRPDPGDPARIRPVRSPPRSRDLHDLHRRPEDHRRPLRTEARTLRPEARGGTPARPRGRARLHAGPPDQRDRPARLPVRLVRHARGGQGARFRLGLVARRGRADRTRLFDHRRPGRTRPVPPRPQAALLRRRRPPPLHPPTPSPAASPPAWPRSGPG